MIDINEEQPIRLEDVANVIPSSRRGKSLSKAVIFRWASKGANGVVLETIRIGGGRFTSRPAIQRFIEAQNTNTKAAKGRKPLRLSKRESASKTLDARLTRQKRA